MLLFFHTGSCVPVPTLTTRRMEMKSLASYWWVLLEEDQSQCLKDYPGQPGGTPWCFSRLNFLDQHIPWIMCLKPLLFAQWIKCKKKGKNIILWFTHLINVLFLLGMAKWINTVSRELHCAITHWVGSVWWKLCHWPVPLAFENLDRDKDFLGIRCLETEISLPGLCLVEKGEWVIHAVTWYLEQEHRQRKP